MPMIRKSDLDEDDNCAKLVARKILANFYSGKTWDLENNLIGFGKGFNEGSICGAISGAIFALNRILIDRDVPKSQIKNIIFEFKEDFKMTYGGVNCSEILKNYIGIQDLDNYDSNIQRLGCSNLLNQTMEEINEIINFAISYANPIMRRFDNI